jgi:hypothetical protein
VSISERAKCNLTEEEAWQKGITLYMPVKNIITGTIFISPFSELSLIIELPKNLITVFKRGNLLSPILCHM